MAAAPAAAGGALPPSAANGGPPGGEGEDSPDPFMPLPEVEVPSPIGTEENATPLMKQASMPRAGLSPPAGPSKPAAAKSAALLPARSRMRRSSSLPGAMRSHTGPGSKQRHSQDDAAPGSMNGVAARHSTVGLSQEEYDMLQDDLATGPSSLEALSGVQDVRRRSSAPPPPAGGLNDSELSGHRSGEPKYTLDDIPPGLAQTGLFSQITPDMDPHDISALVEAALDEEDRLAAPGDDLMEMMQESLQLLSDDTALLNPFYDPKPDVKVTKFQRMTLVISQSHSLQVKCMQLVRRLVRGYDVKQKLQEEAVQKREAAEAMNRGLKDRIAALELELTGLRETLEEREAHIIAEAERYHDGLDRANKHWREQQEQLTARYEQEKAEMQMETRYLIEQAVQAAKNEELGEALIRADRAETKAEEFERLHGQASRELAKVKVQLEELKRAGDSTQGEIQRLEGRVLQLETEREQMIVATEFRVRQHEAELEEYQRKVEDLSKRLGSEEEAISAVKSSFDELRATFTELQRSKEEVDAQLADNVKAKQQLESMVQDQRQQLEDLKTGMDARMAEMYEQQVISIKAEISAEHARKQAQLRHCIAGVFSMYNASNMLSNAYKTWRRWHATIMIERNLLALRDEFGLQKSAASQAQVDALHAELEAAKQKVQQYEDTMQLMHKRMLSMEEQLAHATSNHAVDREQQRQSLELLSVLRKFVLLFKRRFRMRLFNNIRVTQVDFESRLPVVVQVLRISVKVVKTFETLLAVEKRLAKMRVGLTTMTIGERLRLKRLEKKLELQNLPPALRELLEKQRDMITGRITRVHDLRQQVKENKAQVWSTATDQVEESEPHPAEAIVAKSREIIEQEKVEYRREEFMLEMRVWKCVIEHQDSRWVVVAGQRKLLPTRRRHSERAASPQQQQQQQQLLQQQQLQQQRYGHAFSPRAPEIGHPREEIPSPICSVSALGVSRQPPPRVSPQLPSCGAYGSPYRTLQDTALPGLGAGARDRAAHAGTPAVAVYKGAPTVVGRGAQSPPPAAAAVPAAAPPPEPGTVTGLSPNKATGTFCLVGPLPVSKEAQRKAEALLTRGPNQRMTAAATASYTAALGPHIAGSNCNLRVAGKRPSLTQPSVLGSHPAGRRVRMLSAAGQRPIGCCPE
eukprot:TRINITY_DN19736_c0_g1_i2.p1 TRINITY_DN19736_c0_g1~~TRINITY_DN19736_c0_g1_i2.p1  ORF type:complete len:1149 (+),score=414.55 TRINITY_DN19736_c0_g1_i2:92-3538(+)